jgi:hypothetical protein
MLTWEWLEWLEWLPSDCPVIPVIPMSLQVSFSECGMALSQLQICNGQGPRENDIHTN